MTNAIEFRGVRFAPKDGPEVLAGVDLDVRSGEMVLVAGSSGSGKSTLLRCVNGLVPRGTGGSFAGDVIVSGRSTRDYLPRDLASVVGFVHQDPDAHSVVDHVESDVAFALENLGIDAAGMRRRVEEVLDALGIAALRDRAVSSLSGGERQRCAIAGALAAGPDVLVLDEPTSQLDPQGAEDVLAAIARLRDEHGTTVLLSEHRLERVVPYADAAVVLRDRPVGVLCAASPAAALADYAGAPAVMRLGRILGWSPAPLTVRDARRHALPELPQPIAAQPTGDAARVASLGAVTVELGGHRVLGPLSLVIHSGEVIAVVGRNGAGKTTLLRVLGGVQAETTGRVRRDVRTGLVPQDPSPLLLGPTVRADLATTRRLIGGDAPDVIDAWLDRLNLAGLAESHPRRLSIGERQRVAVAAIAVGGAPLLLLDEPTRGMDAGDKDALVAALAAHASDGGAVVVATHDVEVAARVATRVVVLGDGDIVADGATRAILTGSLFAPQVCRVAPPYLTVAEIEAALANAGAGT